LYQAIQNDHPTEEILMWQYRQLLHLSYEDFMNEPTHELFTNMQIYGLIQKKQQLENKHSG